MNVNGRLNNSGISSVQFASWPTEVQDDSLNLVETAFDMRPSTFYPTPMRSLFFRRARRDSSVASCGPHSQMPGGARRPLRVP